MPETAVNYAQWLAALEDENFDALADAAETVLQIHDALANDGLTLLAELFRDRGDTPIETWEHYPADDSRDPQTGAMFYYHAHDPHGWPREEHGHFHLFVRPSADSDFTHVMAIAMTSMGIPNGVFTTNGWVTDETMRPAQEVIELLETRWDIARARPSWLVVQWLTMTLQLLRPYAEKALQARDARLGWDGGSEPSTEILEDQDIHVLSEIPIDYMALLDAIRNEARSRMG